ncbi:MAG TPA: response regulator transcription factor [Acidimicrobiales bacterium]|nr:response regulator transcription factor [Acidimicrobiales bacterium]
MVDGISGARILVVDDDPVLSDVVGRYLERDGFEVLFATDGESGLATALTALPDLVVLDLMLPGLDGIEVCRRLREVAPIAVVMLTARGEEEDRIAGLRIGADDYVTKPFSPGELVERVRAVLRRTLRDSGGRTDPLVAGRLCVDRAAHEARLDGDPLSLTTKEYDLLVHLMSHPRRSFGRDELLESVWGWSFGDTSTVTVHVRRLREKIEDDASTPRHLVTVRGVGYRFDP